MNNFDLCETCGYNFQKCNGHAARINIPYGYLNYFLLDKSIPILKHTCVNCLHYNTDVRHVCWSCYKPFATFNIVMQDDELPIFVQCNKLQAYKI